MGITAISAAITGAQTQQENINVSAHNISNINTTSFKRFATMTADLSYVNSKSAGVMESTESAAPRPVGKQTGMGTRMVGTYRNMELGPLKQTFHPLDIAITGVGYFAIALPNGRTGYTRAGNFQRDAATGNIITTEGNTLATPITIPAEVHTENIQISDSGLITAQDPTDPAAIIEIGQLEIFTFTNEGGLQAIGNNLLIDTVASGEAVAMDDMSNQFKQEFLEQSNVKAVEELTNLIEAQRAYELNTRVISTVDKMMETTNNI